MKKGMSNKPRKMGMRKGDFVGINTERNLSIKSQETLVVGSKSYMIDFSEADGGRFGMINTCGYEVIRRAVVKCEGEKVHEFELVYGSNSNSNTFKKDGKDLKRGDGSGSSSKFKEMVIENLRK